MAWTLLYGTIRSPKAWHGFDNKSWSLLQAARGPTPRAWHGFTSLEDKLYLFGGSGYLDEGNSICMTIPVAIIVHIPVTSL